MSTPTLFPKEWNPSTQPFKTRGRDVAELFGVNHQMVMDGIKNLIRVLDADGPVPCVFEDRTLRAVKDAGASTLYFKAVFQKFETFPDWLIDYELNEDGFALLAMQLNSPKAMRWRLAFLQAHRGMQAAVANGNAA